MINRILINREECEVRVAFMEQQTLVELHTEKFDEQTIVNNIYRGRVQDVVPGLQAAFVDVGLGRNMFLHFMDIRPESLCLSGEDQIESMREAAERGLPGRIERKGRRPKIDPRSGAAPPVRTGDEIIVQVVKDEIGTKAPRVTTNLALAGRYLVMLPFPGQDGGVSKKIAMGPDRVRLKKLLGAIRTDDYSFIIRTAGIDQPEEPVRKDGHALVALWEGILRKYKEVDGPGLIYNDHNLISRLVRDAFPTEFEEVVCDNQDDAIMVEEELQSHMPHAQGVVKLYTGPENVLEAYGAERQIDNAMARKYWLKSGGYLIVDENEALTAIDINTGRFTGKKDQEKTSLKINLEACEAIAQLIRLRDLGGIIVIDFIDMLNRTNQEKVAEELRKELRKDRAKLAIGKIGDFGLMMLTRKRQRGSLHKQMHDDCPYCHGNGYILKPDEVYRRIKYDIAKTIAKDETVHAMMISAHPWTVDFLRTRYRKFLHQLETDQGIHVALREDPNFHLEDYQITPMRRKQDQPLQIPRERFEQDSRIEETLNNVPVDFEAEVVDLPDQEFEEFINSESEAHWDDESKVVPISAEIQDDDEDDDQPQESERPSGGRRRRRKPRPQRTGAQSAPPAAPEKPAQKPAPKPEEPVVDVVENAEVTGEDASDEQTSRRTRRGKRGGRRRRDEGEETSPQAKDAPAAKEPAEASKPVAAPGKYATDVPTKLVVSEELKAEAPAANLKLPKKQSPMLDILGDLDKELETLRAADKPKRGKKTAPKAAAKAAPVKAPVKKQVLTDDLFAIPELETWREEQKPAPAAKPVKKAAPAKKTAAAKAPAAKATAKKAAPAKKAAVKKAPATKATATTKAKATTTKAAATKTTATKTAATKAAPAKKAAAKPAKKTAATEEKPVKRAAPKAKKTTAAKAKTSRAATKKKTTKKDESDS